MAYVFQFKHFTWGDLQLLGRLGQSTNPSVADYVQLLALVQRCSETDLRAVPVTETEALIAVFVQELQTALTSPAAPPPKRKRASPPIPVTDAPTPDADRLLRMLDALMGDGE